MALNHLGVVAEGPSGNQPVTSKEAAAGPAADGIGIVGLTALVAECHLTKPSRIESAPPSLVGLGSTSNGSSSAGRGHKWGWIPTTKSPSMSVLLEPNYTKKARRS